MPNLFCPYILIQICVVYDLRPFWVDTVGIDEAYIYRIIVADIVTVRRIVLFIETNRSMLAYEVRPDKIGLPSRLWLSYVRSQRPVFRVP